MKRTGIVVCLMLAASILSLPTVGAVNTDDRPFQDVHALSVISAVNWNVVGAIDAADALDEWVHDGSTSYAYITANIVDVLQLDLYDLKPAEPYTPSDMVKNQSLTVSMMSVGSGGLEQMLVYLYVCSLGPPPGGVIITIPVSLSRITWTATIIKAPADLTGYWDDLCIGFQGRLLSVGEQARVTWAEFRAPPAKVHGPSAFPLIIGLSALLFAGVTLPVIFPSSKKGRRQG